MKGIFERGGVISPQKEEFGVLFGVTNLFESDNGSVHACEISGFVN